MMRVISVATFSALLLCACGGGGGSQGTPVVPSTPGGGNLGAVPTQTPTLAPTPTPTPSPVVMTEYAVVDEPLYVGADNGGVYFGFGSSGTGSNLQHWGSGGAITTTIQATPPPGYSGGGGVYGIAVMPDNSVYWLSAYFDNRSALPSVQVQCGSTTQATLCEPNVDEPTATIVDANHVFWTGGLTSIGGGQIRTSAGQKFDSPNQGIVTLINGPQQSVWGIVRVQSSSIASDSIAQFAAAGQAITIVRQFPLPGGSNAGSMTLGGDGNLWFADYGRSALGVMTPVGTVVEYPSPHAIAGPSYGQSQIVTACDGTVWYTEANAGAIVRATMSGDLKEYVLPTAGGYAGPVSAPPLQGGICTRKLWVGEVNARKLTQITY